MPSATGLLRLSLVIAAVFAAGIGALVAASALVPTDTVRSAVIAEIRAVTGLEPTIRGEVAVSLFPTAMVSFSDVVLGDAADARDPALTADRLTAKLQLLPLLVGSIEPADMSLTRPRIMVRLEPDGRSNWSNLLATLARTLKPGTPQGQRVLSFSEIRVSGGTITVVEPTRGVPSSCPRWNCRSPGRRSRAASARPAGSSGARRRSMPAPMRPTCSPRCRATAPA